MGGVTKRFLNAQATRLHAELGLPGFAAVHNSHIEHEGIFDWRKHSGKGEGNDAFGAGTYLSTANSVHKYYKQMFTAKSRNTSQYTGEVIGNQFGNAAIEKVKRGLDYEARRGNIVDEYEIAKYIESFQRTAERLLKQAAEFFEYRSKNKTEADFSGLSFTDRAIVSVAESIYDIFKQTGTVPSAMHETLNRLFDDGNAHKSGLNEVNGTVLEYLTQANELTSRSSEVAQFGVMRTSDFTTPKDATSPTYHVAVDIPVGSLLDWDAPLGEQSDTVKAAFKKLLGDLPVGEEIVWEREGSSYEAYVDDSSFTITPDNGWALYQDGSYYGRYESVQQAKEIVETLVGNTTGSGAYNRLAERLGSQAAASEALQKEGVLGHVYNASGGKESQFRNYVIYDDSKIYTFYVERSDQRQGSTPMTDEQRAAVKEHIEKVLGPKIRTEFARMFHAGDFTKYGNGIELIRISTHALDPMSVAYHESLHGFISRMEDAGLHDVAKTLYKAANSIAIKRQLEKLLANEPGALAQIRESMDERVAYMYQFWAAGKLNVGDGAKNILTKIRDFIYKVLGMWSNDQRAVHIMEYFNSGEYAKNMGDRSAVARALLEQGTNKTFEKIKQNLAPIADVAARLAAPGDGVLRAMKNPAITEIVDNIINPTSSERSDPGFINAQRAKWKAVMNGMLADISAVGNVTAEHMSEALEGLQRGERAKTTEARNIQHIVRRTLDDMFDYMRKKGVDVKDLGYGKNYFPRVYDVDYITKNPQQFLDVLEKYVRTGDLKSKPQDILNNIIRNDGADFNIQSTKPGMQALKGRMLKMIPDAELAPFMQKDLLTIMNGYIQQATRRGEWAARFGDDNAKLEDLLKQAEKRHGATTWQIETTRKFIMGVDGTLGDDINPKLRRLSGNAIVYENIRLLPLAVFSMAIDPMGIMVRGGTLKQSWEACKRGFMEIKSGFEKNPKRDEWYKLSEMMGTIDNDSLVHVVGTSYSQGMVGDFGRKANDIFFRLNMVEQMNKSMRVAAMPAALGFIAKHGDGTNSVHSARWLAELGLRPGEVVVKDGRPLLTKEEFMKHGMDEFQAEAMADKMRNAVNKWVDGAVLRPNAAQKPIWMNDPHFALFAHLKQFVYQFNETIMKRVINEARYGNYTPAYALASYVPIMMAADFMKGLLIGGGDEPEWKKDWTLADYTSAGIQRAGLLGPLQFGVDAWKMGIPTLGGPAIEQLVDGIAMLGKPKTTQSFLMDSLPASILAKAAVGDSRGADPTFAG